MFIEPSNTWVSSGFFGYIWLDTKLCKKIHIKRNERKVMIYRLTEMSSTSEYWNWLLLKMLDYSHSQIQSRTQGSSGQGSNKLLERASSLQPLTRTSPLMSLINITQMYQQTRIMNNHCPNWLFVRLLSEWRKRVFSICLTLSREPLPGPTIFPSGF